MISTNINGTLATYVFESKDNLQYNIGYINEVGTLVPLVSPKDQQREANRILGKFYLKDGLLAIIYGIVSIALLEQLVQQQENNGGIIIVIEADPHLAVFYYKQFPNLFQTIWLITSLNQDLLDSIMDNIQVSKITGYRILQISMSVRLSEHFYKEQEYRIKQNLSAKFSDMLTRMEFQESWVLNALSKIPLFSKVFPVRNLFQKGRGLVAILVSTGPSLRDSLTILKKYQDYFFIAVADSAYHVLIEANIRPHLVITLDAQAFTLRHFGGTSFGTSGEFPILYSDLVANNQIIYRWNGPLFMGLTAQYINNQRVVTPGCDYIEQVFHLNTKDTHLGDIQSGGSVATSLFDLLRLMEFDSIVLVGQDLAYTNREIHCIGTHHTKQWFSRNTNRLESIENINEKVLKKRHIQYAKSIQGKRLPEDYILSTYKRWFETALEGILFPVYNATQDGAIIQGSIPLQDLSLLLKENTPLPPLDYWLFGGESIASKEDINLILGSFHSLLDILKKQIPDLWEVSHNKDINSSLLFEFSLFIENNYSFFKYIGWQYHTQAERQKDDSIKKTLLNKKYKAQWLFYKGMVQNIQKYSNLYN